MERLMLALCIAVLITPAAATGQTVTTIESGGAKIVLTVWAPEAAPTATVVLVPGWGGGPTDVLGLGRALSERGISVVVPSPRGWHQSEGEASFAHGMEDIGATLAWVRSSRRPDIAAGNVILGGHSWGGGMALAYAATDPGVRRVFSVAGTDHTQFILRYQRDTVFAAMVDNALAASAAPDGPIRFDQDHILGELAAHPDVYGLMENVYALKDRSILLVGGTRDTNVSLQQTVRPLYLALREAGANDVELVRLPDDHGFGDTRARLHDAVASWILKP